MFYCFLMESSFRYKPIGAYLLENVLNRLLYVLFGSIQMST